MLKNKQVRESFLDKLEAGLVTVFLAGMVLVVFLQVIFRFVIHGSLPWSEELSRYLMVWAVFIGASIGAGKNAHIGVEAFVNFFPAPLKKLSVYISGLVSVLFSFVLMILAFKVLALQAQTGQVSPAMQIPMYIPYMAVAVGSALMGLRFFQAMVEKCRGGV